MILLKSEDIRQVAYAVRHFLMKTGFMQGLSVKAELRLIAPDIQTMRAMHVAIEREMSKAMYIAGNHRPVRATGPNTIEFDCGGITIVLTCQQELGVIDGESIGYNSIQWLEYRGSVFYPRV